MNINHCTTAILGGRGVDVAPGSLLADPCHAHHHLNTAHSTGFRILSAFRPGQPPPFSSSMRPSLCLVAILSVLKERGKAGLSEPQWVPREEILPPAPCQGHLNTQASTSEEHWGGRRDSFSKKTQRGTGWGCQAGAEQGAFGR